LIQVTSSTPLTITTRGLEDVEDAAQAAADARTISIK
jgi:hypothetical protein